MAFLIVPGSFRHGLPRLSGRRRWCHPYVVVVITLLLAILATAAPSAQENRHGSGGNSRPPDEGVYTGLDWCARCMSMEFLDERRISFSFFLFLPLSFLFILFLLFHLHLASVKIYVHPHPSFPCKLRMNKLAFYTRKKSRGNSNLGKVFE